MESVDPLVGTLREWMRTVMQHSMHDFILYSREIGLSPSHLHALSQIGHNEALGVTEVGENLGISSAAASQMLERMVQQGMITRSEDPHDRRAKHLVLTEKGHQVMHRTMEARQRWFNDLAALLTPAEREQIVTTLNLLIERSNQLEQQPEI